MICEAARPHLNNSGWSASSPQIAFFFYMRVRSPPEALLRLPAPCRGRDKLFFVRSAFADASAHANDLPLEIFFFFSAAAATVAASGLLGGETENYPELALRLCRPL